MTHCYRRVCSAVDHTSGIETIKHKCKAVLRGSANLCLPDEDRKVWLSMKLVALALLGNFLYLQPQSPDSELAAKLRAKDELLLIAVIAVIAVRGQMPLRLTSCTSKTETFLGVKRS
jgi:hypothetical protein